MYAIRGKPSGDPAAGPLPGLPDSASQAQPAAVSNDRNAVTELQASGLTGVPDSGLGNSSSNSDGDSQPALPASPKAIHPKR